jgi:predicted  nucleic acid-binding Zn-ribbon protein
MDTPTGLLPEIHKLHTQLETVREKLESGPRKIAAQERLLKQKQEELADCKEKLLELRKSADAKSLQLKTNEAKILDLKAKLNAASSNKEYDIINSQIEADQMANSVLEDEILDALDKVDQGKRDIEAAEAAIASQQSQIAETQREVDASRQGLETEAAELEAALAEKEGKLPSEIIDQYRRLVSAHGAGALASVENDACTACYAILSPQERVALNMGKIQFCRSCGRIIYLEGE